MRKFIITESEKNNIRKMYGLLSEQNVNDIISTYVSDTGLQNILRDIENELGEKFVDAHFKKEIGLSGQIKSEAGGLLPDAIAAFNKMKNESGCNDIFIKEVDDKDSTLPVSYRSYEDQKRRFINEGKISTTGSKIDFAMKRVSIPGFSQHHTGRAIDYGGNTICLRGNAWPAGDFNKPNKWGFTLPYMTGNIRMQEPWHLYYVGGGTSQQTNQKIEVSSRDITSFVNDIATKTSLASIDENSIKFDMDKKTFSVDSGSTKVFKIVLRISEPNKPCESCENTFKKNTEYNPKLLKDIKWENNTRIAQLIALYPVK
jgi:hypothetical protein